MKKFFVYIFLLCLCSEAISQSNSISGQVNQYYSVDSVTDNYVKLSAPPGGLQPGDKVVLMQMTGVTATPTGSFPNFPLAIGSYRFGGKYEMLAVKSVVGDRVYFTVTINSAVYNTGEIFQLVKIYEADYATVIGPVTAKEWDGSTGGVIALVIFKKLTLGNNIDLSGAGFRGGQPELNYAAGCRELSTDTLYYYYDFNGIAGGKGEGIIAHTVNDYYNYTKGPGALITAGGGGLGYFAGGGGGGHWGVGGSGGEQKEGCTTYKTSFGGQNLTFANNFYGTNKVTMGGGGGSSTADLTYTASKGGDGGGIVIIMTDTLEGNSNYILSNGESAGSATAGAGGGGAGGAILLDVNYFKGDISLRVSGGNGGSTVGGTEATGAGGGGGGGIIWHTGLSLPSIGVNKIVTAGNGGDAGDIFRNGNNGNVGSTLANMQLPLNGFLFNTIEGTDTICEGQQPKIIIGSKPRGKSTSYIYEWLQSNDGVSWVPAAGSGDSLSFQPVALTNTTYYTRFVLDTLTYESNTPPEKYVYDTALTIEVLVYPELAGNNLSIRDTICFGQSPGTLTGGAMSGGDGTYVYNWHSSINGTQWTVDRSTNATLNEGDLSQSTYYRRVVSSHKVCIDISNIDTITVLPEITNNIFMPIADTAICQGTDVGLIRATNPSQLGGGDGNYTFRWTESTVVDGSYTLIAGANGVNYPAGILPDDMYYKRIVYSGSDTVCKSITATPFFIEVYDLIGNNRVIGSDIQYVCNNSEKQLFGSDPSGGSGTYGYTWQQWVDGTGWGNADGTNFIGHDYTSPSLTDTVSYRRLANSGEYKQCNDTSDAVLIRINPLPTGDIENDSATFCAEGLLTVSYSKLAGNGPWTITIGDESPLYTTDPPLTGPDGSFSFVVSQSATLRIIEIEDDSSCLAMDTNFVNTVELTIYEIPVANAGNNPVESCSLTTLMNAQPTVGTGLWTGEGVVFAEPSNPLSSVSTSEYGTYNVTWTETNWECIDAQEIALIFYEQPSEPDAGEDQNLDYQFSTTLDAQPAIVGSGTWSFVTGTGDLADSNLYNTEVDFPLVGPYELNWTIVNGTCTPVSNSVQIVVNDLVVFNGFSPNGDGVNDEFILNMSGRSTAKLIVLDKWGGLVVEIDGIEELRWNGENKNGKPVQSDTYFYIIKEEGLPDRKGYIDLRR